MTATGDTEIETAIEIPQVFKYHAFACHTQRPPGHPRGSCGSLGAQPLWDRLGKKLEAERLTDIGFSRLRVSWVLPGWSFDGGLSGRYLVSANHARGYRRNCRVPFQTGQTGGAPRHDIDAQLKTFESGSDPIERIQVSSQIRSRLHHDRFKMNRSRSLSICFVVGSYPKSLQ